VETDISLEYLEALYDEYERFVQEISRTIPVVRVDWDRFQNTEEMAIAVQREFACGSFLRNVAFPVATGNQPWPGV
jgi:hypothetical protein